ncbi:MAG: RecQ family ATP-dependent DNA helicase, partial [Aureibaculum sp.]
MVKPLEVLRKYWHHDSFIEPQDKIISSVLAQNDTVVILPTGGGKSICYQVPALLNEGVCLVISPLIALMTDQINNLKNRGIKALSVTSALKQDDIINAFDNLQFGNYKFLYLSPEKLQSPFIQQKIKQLQINLIAIDEAHCISEWGHDFRPAYLKIPIVKELAQNAPIIALTATATTKVLEDIIHNLEIDGATIIKQSLARKNLSLRIDHSEDIYYQIINILQKSTKPSILYANSRKKVRTVSNYLNRHNFKSTFYHGGLSTEEKSTAFNSWMEEK